MKGYEDSRPEVARPKAGKLSDVKKAGSEPRGQASEVFANKRGGATANWKGMKDSRPG